MPCNLCSRNEVIGNGVQHQGLISCCNFCLRYFFFLSVDVLASVAIVCSPWEGRRLDDPKSEIVRLVRADSYNCRRFLSVPCALLRHRLQIVSAKTFPVFYWFFTSIVTDRIRTSVRLFPMPGLYLARARCLPKITRPRNVIEGIGIAFALEAGDN